MEKRERIELCGNCADKFFETLELVCKDCSNCKEKLEKIKERRKRIKEVTKAALINCCC